MKLWMKSQILIFTAVFVICVFNDWNLAFSENIGNDDLLNSIIIKGSKPLLQFDGRKSKPILTFTEGPSWVGGRLYFSNYYMFWKKFGSSNEGGLCVLNCDGTHTVLNEGIQTCGTKPLPNGNLIACDLIKRGIVEISPDGNVFRTIVDSYNDKPLGMPNDLCLDKKGGFYFTDPIVAEKGEKQPGTAVYYFSMDGIITRLTGWNEYIFPNGCVLSGDGKRFFLNDSKIDSVFVYDVETDGRISNKRVFAKLRTENGKSSMADGMTIDENGNLFVATYTGIQIFSGNGEYAGTVKFPETPSNCVFGGAGRSTLYATCRERIYSLETQVKGLE